MKKEHSRQTKLEMKYFRRYSAGISLVPSDVQILCRVAADYNRDGLPINTIKSLLRIEVLKRHNDDLLDTTKLKSMLLSKDAELNTLALSIIQNLETKKIILLCE